MRRLNSALLGQSLLALTATLAASSACSQVIGADFDAKTVDPDYFNDGGASGSGGSKSSGTGGAMNGSGGTDDGSGGSTNTGGASTGGAGSGGDGSGGSATGGASTGGASTGGAGSGGSATGGSGGDDACAYGDMGCDFDVVINEVRGQGGTDFIELYNVGSDTIDLVGCAVTDSNDRPDFPSGSVLAPGEYWVTYLDLTATCDVDNCNLQDFGISSSGEMVYFKAPNNSTLDSVMYPDELGIDGLTNGQTLGRSPDGTGSFVTNAPATPGAANSAL